MDRIGSPHGASTRRLASTMDDLRYAIHSYHSRGDGLSSPWGGAGQLDRVQRAYLMQEQANKTLYTWRTEPEIDFERQEFLRQRLAIQPDIQRGIYPFK